MALDVDVVEVSAKNLRREGIRTYLTLIGVIIGIAAIVSLLSIGQGLSVSIEKQFEQLGSNTIFVIPAGAMGTGTSGPALTQADIDKMDSVKGISSVVPIYAKTAMLEYRDEKIAVAVDAVDASKADIFENTGFMDVDEGRMLSKNDSSGIIIGHSIAYDAFSRELHTKKQVTLNGVEYKVVGVLKKQNQSIGGGGPSTANTIYMSLEAFKKMSPNDTLTPSIVFAKTFTNEDVADAADQIKKDLEKKYGEKSFTVYTSDQILDQINMVLGLVTMFLAGIGGISLIVGGIGIMNAMITSVLERTKEIGVMKALGASNNKILTIFLLEASFIGGIGGAIGIVIGYVLSIIIATVGNAIGYSLVAVMSPEITIGALVFAMLIGMISGLLPAMRASKLDPVAALRYE